MSLRRVLSPALKLHIPGHSHVQDVSGNGNNGTWDTSAAYVDGPFGRMCVDVTSDGLSAAVTGTYTAISIAAWVQPQSVTGNAAPLETGAYNSAGTAIWRIGSTGWNAYINNASPIITTTGGVTALGWSHLALTAEGTTAVLYENGKQIGTGTLSGSLVVTPYKIPEATVLGGTDFYVADARLYSCALQGDEVASLYRYSKLVA